jgi:hypothetical protein
MDNQKIVVKDELIVSDKVKGIKDEDNETIIPENVDDVNGLDYVD